MNLILFGAPGAGKGTQASLLVNNDGMFQISTGDLFRNAIKNKTDLGLLAKSYMDSGELVPDSVTIAMLKESVNINCKKSLILDGFPRNLDQAAALDHILSNLKLSVDSVVSLEVPFADLLSRISGRRVCRACSAVFHIKANPPKVNGVCDKCGGEIIQRADDSEAVVSERLKVYLNQTEPVKQYYKRKGLLIEINGDQEIEKVYQDIKKNVFINKK